MLVNTFAKPMRSDKQKHLANFYIIVPPLVSDLCLTCACVCVCLCLCLFVCLLPACLSRPSHCGCDTAPQISKEFTIASTLYCWFCADHCVCGAHDQLQGSHHQEEQRRRSVYRRWICDGCVGPSPLLRRVHHALLDGYSCLPPPFFCLTCLRLFAACCCGCW